MNEEQRKLWTHVYATVLAALATNYSLGWQVRRERAEAEANHALRILGIP